MKTIGQVQDVIRQFPEEWENQLQGSWELSLGFYVTKQFLALSKHLANLSVAELMDLIPEELADLWTWRINEDDLTQIQEWLQAIQKFRKFWLLPVASEYYAKYMHNSINHKRKYSGEPYWVHLLEVKEIVASVGGNVQMQSAALLHDVVEDVKIPLTEIEELFGREIMNLVEMLTDVSRPEDGNRRARKAKDLLHTVQASPEAKTIKLADLISNARSIIKDDPDFAKVYIREKQNLLAVLQEGDSRLYQEAQKIIQEYYQNLKN